MKIALTFDDGPSEYTTRILNTLQINEARVTFFVLGSLVEPNKGKIYRASQMGCEVICHAWNHDNFTLMEKRAMKKHILSTMEAIKAITGSTPPLFRPPYGEYDEKVAKVAKKLKMSMINWTLSSQDYENKDAGEIYDIILDRAKDGDVVLCHDVYDATATAMGRVVPDLMKKGFELVTVSEMLRYKYGIPQPGMMYFEPD